MEISRLTVRIYALILNDRSEILLSEEFHHNMKMCKFPGGGLELGESTLACLRREMREELGAEIEIIEHFYTTDFFQKSQFQQDTQVLAIYYLAKLLNTPTSSASKYPFELCELKNGSLSHRWQALDSFTPEILTFPFDKKAASLLLEQKNRLLKSLNISIL